MTGRAISLRVAASLAVCGMLLLLVATAARSSASPSRIAFWSVNAEASLIEWDRDVVVADPGTGQIVDLTPDPPGVRIQDTEPSWSSDGTKVVFASSRDTSAPFQLSEIYVMNADGSQPTRLTSDSGPEGGWNLSPEWSPTGPTIAFLKQRWTNDRDVYVVQEDGTGLRRLTADGGEKTALAWSPDGRSLLYHRNGAVVDGNPIPSDQRPPGAVSLSERQLYVVDVATGTRRRLGPPAVWPLASWSPDGMHVAFHAGPQLWVVSSNGGEPRALLGAEADGPTWTLGVPSWSPDGKTIAAVLSRCVPLPTPVYCAPVSDVALVSVDGASVRALTDHSRGGTVDPPVASSRPTFWPDGRRLFFNRIPTSGSTRLWVMNVDGSCRRPFAAIERQLRDPAWTPGAAPNLPPLRCIDLELTGRSSERVVARYGGARYTLTLRNAGNEPATGVRVESGQTTGDFVVSSAGTPCSGGRTLQCLVPRLEAGHSITIGFEVRASGPGLIGGEFSAAANQDDGDVLNNSIRLTTPVEPCDRVGSAGDDDLVGTSGSDSICGWAGSDRIRGLRGNDHLEGGEGNDTVLAGSGRDTIGGGGGADTIVARDAARDRVQCGPELDVVFADRVDRIAADCERVARR